MGDLKVPVAVTATETIEAISNAVLAASASYTPGVSGIFSNAGNAQQIGVQYYSDGGGTWYSPRNLATQTKGLTAIGDGSNFRLRNGSGSNQEYYLFRHYISTGTYERALDADQASLATYTPSSGFCAQAGETSEVKIECQFAGYGWSEWYEIDLAVSKPLTITIGDGSNLRVKNTNGAEARWVVVMRAVMT